MIIYQQGSIKEFKTELESVIRKIEELEQQS